MWMFSAALAIQWSKFFLLLPTSKLIGNLCNWFICAPFQTSMRDACVVQHRWMEAVRFASGSPRKCHDQQEAGSIAGTKNVGYRGFYLLWTDPYGCYMIFAYFCRDSAQIPPSPALPSCCFYFQWRSWSMGRPSKANAKRHLWTAAATCDETWEPKQTQQIWGSTKMMWAGAYNQWLDFSSKST